MAVMQHLTGIQIIILYTGEIMQSVWPSLSKIVPVLMQIMGLFASIITFHTINFYGRKTLIQRSTLAMVPLHLLVFLCFMLQDSESSSSKLLHLVIVCALIVLRSLFSLRMGPLLWIYLP